MILTGRDVAWRATLVFAAAVAAGLVLFTLASKTVLRWNGDAGWTLAPAARAFSVRIASVTSGGPAARAGLREGDVVDLRSVGFDDRVFLVTGPVAARAVGVVAERGGVPVRAVVVPARSPMRWDGWIGYLVPLWMAAFAALIAWRRPDRGKARLLSIVLSSYVAGDVLQFVSTPSAALDAVFSSLNTGGVLGAISLAVTVRFIELFGRPLTIVRRVADGAAYAAAAMLALYGVVSAAALAFGFIDPVPLYFGAGAAVLICGAQLLVVVAGTCAVGASRGAERQRVAWAIASIGTLFVAASAQIALDLLVPTTDMELATQVAVNVVAVLAPIGLTYSVLSRRLLDIGFALNRAAVFSAVSLIVVGAFMAIEWALSNWLATVKHTTSTLVGLALAIVLGFSIKWLHKRVDHAVDHVFFRKRHEQERALLRFANEAAYVTTTDGLLRRTVAEIEEHSGAGSVAILRHDGEGAFAAVCASGPVPPAVDENDPVFVAMRASKEPVVLRKFRTAVSGECAFPMIARGELIGVLVCGPKGDGEQYAPDETATFATLTHAVGAALDALGHRAPNDGDAVLALRVEVAALRDDVRELLAALRAAERT